MRLRLLRNNTLAVAASLATGALALTALAAPATAHAADGSCTPTWSTVPAPAMPTGGAATNGFTTPAPGSYVYGTIASWARDGVGFTGSVQPQAAGALGPWNLRWNGHTITAMLDMPIDGLALGLHTSGSAFDSDSDGWVIGVSIQSAGFEQPFAAHWHDGGWTYASMPPSPDVTTTWTQPVAVAAISPSDAWLVGGLALPGGQVHTGALIEHWDGRAWSVVPNPAEQTASSNLLAVHAVSATDVWAVGYTAASGTDLPLLEHYDGTSWQVVSVPAGSAPSEFEAVSASGPDDVWAVGGQTIPGTDNTATPLVEHFDGTSWSAVDLNDQDNALLSGVYAASPTDVWATQQVSAHAAQSLLHYDGTAWSTVPWPAPAEYDQITQVTGITGFGPDDVWALGWATDDGSDGWATELQIAHLSCAGS